MEKEPRDWKMIIGIGILLVVFAIVGGSFWKMVGKQAELVAEQEKKEEEEAITAIYIEAGETLKQPVFVDTKTETVFTAKVPEDGIYNKKGTLIEGDVLEVGDVVKVYGDGIMTLSLPGNYPGVTKMKRVRRASLEETEKYKKMIEELMDSAVAE